MKKKNYYPPFPNVIKIGYQPISVIFWEFEEDIQGSYLSDLRQIKIQKDLDPIEVLNTIIHECLHASIYCYGIKSFFKDDDEEENLVNVLGNALTEIITRNPDWAKWIKENL